MDAAWWGFIGTVIGALASIGTTYLSNKSAIDLQNETSKNERRERHRSFQRETMLQLQDALHDAIRLIAKVHTEDKQAFSETGKWGKNLLGDELSEGLRLANRKVMLLVERIADDSVRADVKNTMEMATNVTFCESQEQSEALLDRVFNESVVSIEKIGAALRSLY